MYNMRVAILKHAKFCDYDVLILVCVKAGSSPALQQTEGNL